MSTVPNIESLESRLQKATNALRNNAVDSKEELKTLLKEVSDSTRTSAGLSILREEIDEVQNALNSMPPSVPTRAEQTAIVEIHTMLEALRAKVGEPQYFIPEYQEEEKKASGISQYFTGAWTSITAGFGSVLSFFGFQAGKERTSSVGSSAMLKAGLFGLSFVPSAIGQYLPGFEEMKETMGRKIAHIEATKKVEKFVASANKNRYGQDKIAVDLKDYELFETQMHKHLQDDFVKFPGKLPAKAGALADAAIRGGQVKNGVPLRWDVIAAANIDASAVAVAAAPTAATTIAPSATPAAAPSVPSGV